MNQQQDPPERQGAAQPGAAAGEQPAPNTDRPAQEPPTVPEGDGQPKPELKDVITRGRRRLEEAAGERDAARRFIIEVQGDLYNTGWLAGGNQSVAGKDDIAQCPVPLDRLQRVLDVFVPPDYYGRALEVLRARRLVVLCGHPDLGKVTAALHLLLSCVPRGSDKVVQLDPTVDPSRLMTFEPEDGHRYVLAGMSSEQAERLTAFVLDGLSQALGRSDGHLVVTVDRTTLLESEELRGLVRCTAPPDPMCLLERHVDWYLRRARHDAEQREIYQNERVKALVADRPTPRQVNRLAERLAEVVCGRSSLDVALSQVDLQVRQDVARWFAKSHTLLDRSFMIAMAVLAGASYQSVLDAARRLYELLAGPRSDRDEGWYFEKTRAQRLEEVVAHAVSVEATTAIGQTPLQAVEFDNLAWQRTVLRYLRDQYDVIWKPLITWFRSLCDNSDAVVRARAGIALGELCVYDFGHLWGEILEPWAGSENEWMRRSAASALAVPAWDDALALKVRSALLHWSGDDAGWRQRWTAAAAFGVYYVGLRFPDDAVKNLERLLKRDEEPDVVGIAAESMAGLFDVGQDARERYDYFAGVLDALERLSGPDERSEVVRLASLLTFLKIAYESETGATTELGRLWPTLLRLTSSADATAEAANGLLRRSFSNHITRQPAFEVFERWLRGAKDDPELLTAVEGLMMTVARTEREQVRFQHQLRKWKRDDDLCSAAERLLARLTPLRLGSSGR